MGHSHGRKWTNEDIANGIKEVMEKANIKTFPSHTLMKEITGNDALTNAVSRHGGSRKWAVMLGLEMKPSESEYGREYELRCIETLTNILYLNCELTPPRYPYDVLAESNIKIDVKVGRLYRGKSGSFYTFNLEKEKPTCDIFVCYCVDGTRDNTVFIIPSCVLSGKTQLSIGEIISKYDNYIDCWELVNTYKSFYANMAG